jgi:hypothetical protein
MRIVGVKSKINTFAVGNTFFNINSKEKIYKSFYKLPLIPQ